jgi:membrane associated rhomboid family serine protease
MIGVRFDGDEIWLEAEEWERWVQDGRIPPQAWILVEGRGWVRASDLQVYRSAMRRSRPPRPPEPPKLRHVLFPRRGFSATEFLILGNVLVTVVLLFLLGSSYLAEVRSWTADWWRAVREDHAYGWWFVTIFMHAGPDHLGRNMVSLLAAAGAVEFLMGRRWALGAYVLTGVAGMAVSYWGHEGPPLSIGASGAVFGLAGCTVAFIARRYGTFTYRQRWKARRVYVPLFILLFIPSLLHADYWGHTGGLAAGLILGLLLPPHPRIRELAEVDAMGETEEAVGKPPPARPLVGRFPRPRPHTDREGSSDPGRTKRRRPGGRRRDPRPGEPR